MQLEHIYVYADIFRGPHGFGFSEPYNVYSTLMEFVLHYAVNSLEEHNEKLKTTLMFPVGGGKFLLDMYFTSH